MGPTSQVRKISPVAVPATPAARRLSAPALASEPRRRRISRRDLSLQIIRSWAEEELAIQELSLPRLREAIRSNRVSFPSQVPTFSKHDRPDLQRRVVQLYFVLGWNCNNIANRFGIIRQRVQQILNTWKRRAIEMGYLQYATLLEETSPMPAKSSNGCVPAGLPFASYGVPELRGELPN